MDLTAAGSGAPLVFLEFGLLLLGLGLLARIADWLAISAVPLYLVVGLFFGEGTPIGFDASDEFVSTVSELGMVMLLLFLGMEYSSRTLLDGAATTARTGVVDVLLNATPGRSPGCCWAGERWVQWPSAASRMSPAPASSASSCGTSAGAGIRRRPGSSACWWSRTS